MYSRNFGKERSAPPPPAYGGVMYPREDAREGAIEETPQRDAPTEEQAMPAPFEERKESCVGESAQKADVQPKKGLGSLFGRTLTFEDLLLIGLILILVDSGADDELLILLAFLLLAGK